MQTRYGPIVGYKFLAWIETELGLVALDAGWDLANGEPYAGSDLEALMQASEASGLPLSHVLLTHDHFDHVGNLPWLRERWPAVQVLAHTRSGVEGVSQRLVGDETLEFGTLRVQVHHTPGHSARGDELCFFLPQINFLFSGDVAQPQGSSYASASGVSPVPSFHDGAAFRDTLERLIALDAHRARTGHGDWLGPEQVRQWLRVTLATLTRVEELAIELVERYPVKGEDWLTETIYDTIADERHFGWRAAAARKNPTSDGPSAFQRYDQPGLLWAVRAARAVG